MKTLYLIQLLNVIFFTMAKFELLTLPYGAKALEPVISEQTIAYHHGRHLQGYVNNLNKLAEGTPFESMNLEDIVRQSDGGMQNNAGQILNHNLYFLQFAAPSSDARPVGDLAAAIDRQFGSFENFQKEFVQAGAALFGSGWVWLEAGADGKLYISQYANAANPVQKGLTPLLTFDVWEHAYYLDWQNRRPDYLNALWQIIDWQVIEERYQGR
ncbi:MAG: superoxide dismutase [Bacteroidales bacterium]|nr:superoxide dismutase [Bacteroidales bacterium]